MIVPYPTGLEPKEDPNRTGSDDQWSILEVGAWRMVLLRILTDIILGILFLILAWRTSAPQLYILAAITGLVILVDVAGAVLIRRNQATLGATLVIGGLLVLLTGTTVLISGLGVVLGLSAVIVTASSAIQALPPRQAGRMIVISIFIGLAVTVLDQVLPTAARTTVPQPIRAAIPGLVAILIGIYGLLIARQFNYYTLRTKLVMAFLLVSLVPVGFLAFLNDRSSRLALTEAANQALFAAASKTASNLDSFIQGTLDGIQNQAEIPVLREYLLLTPEEQAISELKPEVLALLNTFKGSDPDHILTYTLLDKDGKVVVDTTDMVEGETPPFMEIDTWVANNFKTVLLTNYPSISPVKYDPELRRSFIYFTARVSDFAENSKPIGGLIARYDANILQSLVAANNGIAGRDSFGVLFDEFNIHLAHGTDPSTIRKTVAPLPAQQLNNLILGFRLPDLPADQLTTNLPELDANLDALADEPYFTAMDVATGDRVNQVAVAELENQQWQVAFFQPEDVFLAPVERQTRVTLLLAVLIASIMIVAAILAAQLIAAPISRLTSVAVQVASGDLEAQMPIQTADEIGTLARTFNAMTEQLKNTLRGLESQVEDRTQDLNRRAVQLQTAAQVAKEAAAIREIDQLLNEITHVISEQFGFYHCGIFLLDDNQEYAILRAASSEGGLRMLAREHKLRVGRTGIVGFVASQGEPRIALDVGADAVYFDNPDMPQTRSEMALPMAIQDQIIGVLDVQSKKERAFTDEDVEVLQILADQIALAIENARLLDASHAALLQLEALYKEQVRDTWKKRLQNQTLAYRYDRISVHPAQDESFERYLARQTGDNGREVEGQERLLVTPINLRGQKVGSIVLKRDPDQSPWTNEESRLAEEIINQLSLALENTRLYEESRQRAERERTISEVSDVIRRSLDLETVLQSAAREMRAALDLDMVEIRMGANQESGDQVSPANTSPNPTNGSTPVREQ